MYYNALLMYHLGMSKNDIEQMSDEEWFKWIAILADIRKQEAKQKPFGK